MNKIWQPSIQGRKKKFVIVSGAGFGPIENIQQTVLFWVCGDLSMQMVKPWA